jgi:hypothetical protein
MDHRPSSTSAASLGRPSPRVDVAPLFATLSVALFALDTGSEVLDRLDIKHLGLFAADDLSLLATLAVDALLG